MSSTRTPFDQQDNQDWYDMLAGRAVADADPVTRSEAELVRKAALVWKQAEIVSPQQLDQGWQNLSKTLQQAGILDDPTPTLPQRLKSWFGSNRGAGRPSAGPSWQTYGGIAVAAALVGVLALSPALHKIFMPYPVVEPKSFIIPQEVPAAEPEERARSLLSALQAQDIPAKLDPLGPGWRVTFDLPEQPSPALQTTMKEFNLIPPPPPERQVQTLFLRPGQ
jgi:hypothetical protein